MIRKMRETSVNSLLYNNRLIYNTKKVFKCGEYVDHSPINSATLFFNLPHFVVARSVCSAPTSVYHKYRKDTRPRPPYLHAK